MDAPLSQRGAEKVPPKQWICGLDIAAQTFTATLICQDRVVDAPSPFDNSRSGYDRLRAWMAGYGVPCPGSSTWTGNRDEAPLIVMEATGVYWEECALELHKQGFEVNVVNPARIKYFAQSNLRRAKTDKVDANLIARFAQKNDLNRWTPPDLELEALQLIMRQREALLAMLTEEKNRLHALERRPHVPKSVLTITREHIEFLQKRIKDLEDGFKDELKRFPQWHHAMELLQSIPGVGFVTAAVLLTETQNLNSFHSAKQLTAYAGIAPQPRTSGTSVKGKTRISKIGNSKLRRAVYMAALTAARYNTQLRAFYLRLLEQNKPKKVALVAVARKLLIFTFAILKSGIPYDPGFVSVRAC